MLNKKKGTFDKKIPNLLKSAPKRRSFFGRNKVSLVMNFNLFRRKSNAKLNGVCSNRNLNGEKY